MHGVQDVLCGLLCRTPSASPRVDPQAVNVVACDFTRSLRGTLTRVFIVNGNNTTNGVTLGIVIGVGVSVDIAVAAHHDPGVVSFHCGAVTACVEQVVVVESDCC